MRRLVHFAIVLMMIPASRCANILMMIHHGSPSHKNVFRPLATALAARGHNVTLLSPFVDNIEAPGVTQLHPEKLVQLINGILDSAVLQDDESPFLERISKQINGVMSAIIDGCRLSLEDGTVLRQRPRYDLVFMDEFGCDCGLAVAYAHRALSAYISTHSYGPQIGWRSGNPNFLSVMSAGTTTLTSFWTRLATALFVYVFLVPIRDYYVFPKLESIGRSLLVDEKMPSFAELQAEVSLNLVNGHFSVEMPRPLLPNIVEVGGMHCVPSKPLPKDVNQFVEESGDHGFIYVSFGTAVRTSQFSKERRQAFVDVFAQLNQRVVWKWNEDGDGKHLSPNVKRYKWLPQQDVLGHPKIRLFITHGGLLSQQEAIFHGVPIITVPFFGDQDANAARAEADGYGLALRLPDITPERLLSDVRRILEEPTFRDTARRMSRRFRDQPQTPLERAVYWTEYVLRHDGAPHMRSPARNMPFYQYLMLDVVAVVLTILFILTMILYGILNCCCRVVCGGRRGNFTKPKNE